MDADLRLSRRVLRDTEEYGRAIDVVLTEYQQFVKPSFEEFTLPVGRGTDDKSLMFLYSH